MTTLLAMAAAFWIATADGPADTAPTLTPVDEPKGLEHLNPELAGSGFRVEPGPRPFARRLEFSPGYGSLGGDRLYTLRFAYNPNRWFGYEAAVGHTPGDATHALLHTLNVVARYPLPWRLQPYLTGGWGMIMVYPGRSLNASPVTKNVAAIGGGLEIYIRSDVALRGELRQVTVLGSERNSSETVTFDYGEATVGFAFYRTLGR